MHEFQADLLIGGMRLQRLHGELEQEDHRRGSKDWTLAGHLHLSAEQLRHLELNREYRIQLEDGRAAQVVILRIDDQAADEALADFAPSRPAKRKAK
ncbi:MAG TPA: hypothetical protein VKB78_12065 [Pirellulales bacterium]|nr:hypothetical protein [Pirellulales bacterium]